MIKTQALTGDAKLLKDAQVISTLKAMGAKRDLMTGGWVIAEANHAKAQRYVNDMAVYFAEQAEIANNRTKRTPSYFGGDEACTHNELH